MRYLTRIRVLAVGALLSFAACATEEPAVQDSALDEGGLYEDGTLEQVQPVEPEVVPGVDTARVGPGY